MEKPTILYVDDELMNLKAFAINLDRSYNILMAENAFSGLEMLEMNPQISLVVSDMRMPKMDGLEFIDKARQKYPNKTYYILTGYGLNEDIQAALDRGLIKKYFSKPFNLQAIESEFEEVTRSLP
ncbi:MAG: response regulator [Bacteroidota bacterium]